MYPRYPAGRGTPQVKTQLCKNFQQQGRCSYGSRCHFAHGEHQLQQQPRPPSPTGPPPPPFTYAVGAVLDEDEYVRLFGPWLLPGLQFPHYQDTQEEDRQRLTIARKKEAQGTLDSPGPGASGFKITLDRQERAVIGAFHYQATGLAQVPAHELGRVLDCLSDRMARITTPPHGERRGVHAAATAPEAASPTPGVIKISCGKKADGGWMRSWCLTIKAYMPVADYLRYSRSLLALQCPDQPLADEGHYALRTCKDLAPQLEEGVRPYCNNWARLRIRQGGIRIAGSSSVTAAPQAADELAASLARMALKESGNGASATEKQGRGGNSAASPRLEDDAGGGSSSSGVSGPAVSEQLDLSAHFHANFFELPEHLQPPSAAGGVRWFGSRSAPVLLAVPGSSAAAAEGSVGGGGLVAALNGFGAEAAAKLAQGFAELFGAEGHGGPMQQSHRQKGYGLFFVPLYV